MLWYIISVSLLIFIIAYDKAKRLCTIQKHIGTMLQHALELGDYLNVSKTYCTITVLVDIYFV